MKDEQTILNIVERAYKEREPKDFLAFLRGFRRTYDSERLTKRFDELAAEAQRQLDEVEP